MISKEVLGMELRMKFEAEWNKVEGNKTKSRCSDILMTL
jgi:hypothetical protein